MSIETLLEISELTIEDTAERLDAVEDRVVEAPAGCSLRSSGRRVCASGRQGRSPLFRAAAVVADVEEDAARQGRKEVVAAKKAAAMTAAAAGTNA